MAVRVKGSSSSCHVRRVPRQLPAAEGTPAQPPAVEAPGPAWGAPLVLSPQLWWLQARPGGPHGLGLRSLQLEAHASWSAVWED